MIYNNLLSNIPLEVPRAMHPPRSRISYVPKDAACSSLLSHNTPPPPAYVFPTGVPRS
ncbi:hypothetical protein T484DRAFT_1954954 [Baffinella frigidus]|nr:hypothetical protein T484DRAFT_1954954 [Cryptophyta sp. CCMP2293]